MCGRSRRRWGPEEFFLDFWGRECYLRKHFSQRGKFSPKKINKLLKILTITLIEGGGVGCFERGGPYHIRRQGEFYRIGKEYGLTVESTGRGKHP
jgi:hypothetical protein